MSKSADRVARCVVSGIILGAAAYGFACGTDDSGADPLEFREPPADPVDRFWQLKDIGAATNFTAMYSLDTGSGFDDEQFRWTQLDQVKRWDQVARDGAKLSGTTVIFSAAGSAVTCTWVVRKEQGDGDAVCSPSESDLLHNLVEGFSVLPDLGFAGYKRVSSFVSECFETSNPVVSGHICMTDAGIPTEIDSLVSLGGFNHKLTIRAEMLGPAPSRDEVVDPVLSYSEPLRSEVLRRNLPISEMNLPSMPIVQNYFSPEN